MEEGGQRQNGQNQPWYNTAADSHTGRTARSRTGAARIHTVHEYPRRKNNICNTQEHRSEHRGVAFAQNNVQVSNETSTKQSHDIRHRVLCKKYETVSPSRGCNYT